MARNNSKQTTTWKDKAKRYGKIALIIAGAVGLFNIGQGAKQMAKKNKQFVEAPNYEVSYLPGGSERFKSEFEKIQ